MITHAEANELFLKCISDVEDIGIELGEIYLPLEFSDVASWCGYCQRDKETGKYHIKISEALLQDKVELIDTFYHEILHATTDTRGHCEQWLRYADMINEAYDQDISRVGSNVMMKINYLEKARYAVQCPLCGNLFFRLIKSKAITSDGWCMCEGNKEKEYTQENKLQRVNVDKARKEEIKRLRGER